MMQDHFCKITIKSTMLLLSVVVLIDFLTVFAEVELTAVVKTTSGPVRGEILTNINSVKYASFKGIRYAKAPVGYLRFKPPVPVDPWTKILNATVDGDDCPQVNEYSEMYSGTEDCLFLSVTTPLTNLTKIPRNLKPVMVFIYGGALAFGSSSTRELQPNYIIEKDVVYVAMNYRLGPLGFLSLRHPNATGNVGLKDQVFALKWVQANIRQFGGNPNNVTLVGHSSGGTSTGLHVLSEASAGLFHGTISMSGSLLMMNVFQPPAAAQAQSEKLAAALGATSNCKDDVLKILYNASAEDITTAATKSQPRYGSFILTIEDETIATDAFMTQCPVIKYFTGNFTKVPQIMGYAEQEFLWFLSSLKTVSTFFRGYLDFYWESRSEWPEKLVAATNILDSWMNNSHRDLNNTEIQTFVNVTSDVVFKAHIDLHQRVLATYNDDKPIYYYKVSYFSYPALHNTEQKVPIPGAGHVDDLAFLMYYPEMNFSTDPLDPTRRTIDRVTTMYTNFVKYGDPTPNWINDTFLNVTWPNSGISGTTLDIGTELTVIPRCISDVSKFIQRKSWPLYGKVEGCHA